MGTRDRDRARCSSPGGVGTPGQVALDLADPEPRERPPVPGTLLELLRTSDALDKVVRSVTGRRASTTRHFVAAAAFFRTASHSLPVETVQATMEHILSVKPGEEFFQIGASVDGRKAVFPRAGLTRTTRARYHQLAWAVRRMSERDAVVCELQRIAEGL